MAMIWEVLHSLLDVLQSRIREISKLEITDLQFHL